MKNKDSNKLKISPFRIIRIFAVTFLIFEIIFYLTFQGVNGTMWPLDNSFYYYTPALIVATIVFGAISITSTYYEIDGVHLIHSKMGKIYEYTLNNIIYIDKKFSESKKMMRFFTKDGKEHILVFDKHGQIYTTALIKCPLISEEEFLRRFPKVKM